MFTEKPKEQPSQDDIELGPTEEKGWIDIDLRRLPKERIVADNPTGISDLREQPSPKKDEITILDTPDNEIIISDAPKSEKDEIIISDIPKDKKDEIEILSDDDEE
ncbi:MAG: hypothetical protein A3B23_00245 [Candidatus Colwellbacteria bacterium RIFCSPLOWO2_01_FULL_48_10]|uniref:Uncharacterized protein n=1 Tax=Candidatus Colwellbacteria bacterium RIFCSPLOWO2_01_FULL_48_10 TaxID=1797690 RepID=A0A1G1Z6S2_9BACT|nr:MAG: hypothetical protein A3B23_00245 [Candidatus Colwellbacteria bacterium RIFCSPLOWO2_01_FULL_48_10]